MSEATLMTVDVKKCRKTQQHVYVYNIFHILAYIRLPGAKGDWDFRISDLVKSPHGTDI